MKFEESPAFRERHALLGAEIIVNNSLVESMHLEERRMAAAAAAAASGDSLEKVLGFLNSQTAMAAASRRRDIESAPGIVAPAENATHGANGPQVVAPGASGSSSGVGSSGPPPATQSLPPVKTDGARAAAAAQLQGSSSPPPPPQIVPPSNGTTGGHRVSPRQYGGVCTGVNCPANSACADNSGAAVCYCNQGYVVQDNQCVLDVCSGVSCPANSACGNNNGAAACYCNQGYKVENNACVLDVCSGVSCPDHSTCGDNNGAAACYCDQGYVAQNNACVLPDPCSGVSCPANSACSNNNGAATCYCNQGYVAQNNQCVLPDPCSGMGCPTNSACKNNNGAAACYCNQGYVAQNNACVRPDVCAGVKCMTHGKCVNQNGKAACICASGYVLKSKLCVATGGGGGTTTKRSFGAQPASELPKFLNIYSRHASVAALPSSSVDWSSIWGGAVRNQDPPGSSCLSCWAHAAAAAIEAALFINGEGRLQLSVEQLMDCQLAVGCSTGGWSQTALDRLAAAAPHNRGLVLESRYPYKPSGAPKKCAVGAAVTPRATITGFELVAASEAALMAAVRRQPVIVNIAAGSSSFINYRGGVLKDTGCGIDLNHNVLVVGYGVDAATRVPYWRARNSWGTGWGERGYVRIARVGNNAALLAAYGAFGVCGITATRAMYPINAWLDKGSARVVNPCQGINPCGQGTCQLDKSRTVVYLGGNVRFFGYSCACPRGFVAVTNTDGKATCASANICQSFLYNPCGVGKCQNTGQASYTCACPPGYVDAAQFVVGETHTCIQGGAASGAAVTYKVKAGDTCYNIQTMFGLSFYDFYKVLNPSTAERKCGPQLQIGTVFAVGRSVQTKTTLFYSAQKGDSCFSIDQIFGANTVKKFNPEVCCGDGSTCRPGTAIQVGQQVGVSQDRALLGFTCQQWYNIRAGDTCASIVRQRPVSGNARRFYQINSGINCNSLLVNNAAFVGARVCLSALGAGGLSCKRPRKFYSVRRGDNAWLLARQHFKGSIRSFLVANPFQRDLLIRPGDRVCV